MPNIESGLLLITCSVVSPENNGGLRGSKGRCPALDTNLIKQIVLYSSLPGAGGGLAWFL